MAESNPTQVILTDDGIKIINAQNTADKAFSGVDKINNPNQLGPAEKQTLRRKYQTDKLVYDMDIKMLTDAGLPIAELQNAINALDSFITPYFKDMGKTEQVDRTRLNQVFNNFDTADKNASNAFNSMVSNTAKAAKEAGSDAKEAGEEAKASATKAKADATQAIADAAAAQQALNNIHLSVKNADGSTSTFNMNDNTILMDTAKTIINGKTSILDGTIDTAKIANAAINTAQIADAAITNEKVGNLDAGKITTGIMDASHINVDQLIANGINGKTITGITINTPNLNLGDNGQITGSYSVHDDIGWFQPINGTGSLKIANGYIQSTAHILYYNKILKGIGGDKWGHWASSTQFVPAPNQAHPDIGNIAESTLTPAFLKLDILSDDKSAVNSRVYIDGTGLYINDGNGSQAISAMLSDYELVSSGMAYLNSGIQMKQEASFTFGNLAMTGYHTIAMLDGKALYFVDKVGGGSPIEIVAKTFTKSSRLSIKHDITPLSTTESSRLLNAIDVEKFRYTNDKATYKYQYGGVIDDVNSPNSKQYSMPHELLNEDGTGINLDSLTGVLIKRVQDQDKTIGELSMRLTRLEMEK